MSHLELWLRFLVCCQLKQIWRAPSVDGGGREGVSGPCRRIHVGRASSIIVINHQLRIFIHHRNTLLPPQGEWSGDVGIGSSVFCLASYSFSSWLSVRNFPPWWLHNVRKQYCTGDFHLNMSGILRKRTCSHVTCALALCSQGCVSALQQTGLYLNKYTISHCFGKEAQGYWNY